MYFIIKLINIIILFIIILYLYIQTKKITSYVKPDIIISPSGYYGFYTLGICHYIKKHFSIENKKISGFSSGSFNGLYLTMNNKKKNNKLLKLLLKMGKYNNLNEMAIHFKNKFIHKFKLNDFNNNLYIGLSHINKLGIYNEFNDIEELINCCYGSSFIPYVTMKKTIYIYNKKLTLDGMIYYKKFKNSLKNENILFISPKMFGRYTKSLTIRNLIKPKCGINKLFLLGYTDAKQHHNLLKSYF